MDDELSELRALATETRALTAIVAKMAARVMHERLAQSGMGVTPIQVGIIRILSAHPHTSSELSKMFVLDPSTLVPIIDGLETRGLIERGRDPNDRRRVPLVLTLAGEDVINEVEAMADDDAMVTALKALGTDKAVQLRDLLRELLRELPEGADAMCSMQDRLTRLESVQTDRAATSADASA